MVAMMHEAAVWCGGVLRSNYLYIDIDVRAGGWMTTHCVAQCPRHLETLLILNLCT